MFLLCVDHLKAFGEVFASIGVREPQPSASEAFSTFGEAHRTIEKHAITMLKKVKPVRYMEIISLDTVSSYMWNESIKQLFYRRSFNENEFDQTMVVFIFYIIFCR